MIIRQAKVEPHVLFRRRLFHDLLRLILWLIPQLRPPSHTVHRHLSRSQSLQTLHLARPLYSNLLYRGGYRLCVYQTALDGAARHRIVNSVPFKHLTRGLNRNADRSNGLPPVSWL